jgi:hypothetical protein
LRLQVGERFKDLAAALIINRATRAARWERWQLRNSA